MFETNLSFHCCRCRLKKLNSFKLNTDQEKNVKKTEIYVCTRHILTVFKTTIITHHFKLICTYMLRNHFFLLRLTMSTCPRKVNSVKKK